MPTYTIFAGVNGAGKTSIYQSIYYNENKNEKRINTDEMVARIGSWQDKHLQLKCGREAVKLIKEYINNKISFNQETTLCGKSIIRNIQLAKNNGFYIVINYIGLKDSELAKKRVRIRVKKGGHGISDNDIERRYYDSLRNLIEILPLCDEVNIYDNTEMLTEIIYFNNGKISWANSYIPKWAQYLLSK